MLRDVRTITDRSEVLNWSKYKNWTIQMVLDHDPQFLVWAQNKVPWFDLDHKILDEAENSTVRCT